jgi:hypothetical protein
MFYGWIIAVTGACVVYAVRTTGTFPIEPTNWQSLLSFLGSVLLGTLLGPPSGLLSAWFILGPIYQWRATVNGAPYHIGDNVYVIRGPNSGRVFSVYEVWPGRSQVRLDLGEDKREKVTDVFSETEVVRADGTRK